MTRPLSMLFSTALSHGWNALRRPRVLFAAFADGSSLGSALLFLALLGFLSGITGTHAALHGKTSYGQDWWREMRVFTAVMQGIWFCITDVFWATLLTWFLARMARASMRFDALYTVLAIAAFPLVLTMLAFPLRNVSLLSLHLWQAIHLGVVVWVSLLICLGVQTCMDSTLSKAVQSCLPALLILWALAYRVHTATPSSFRAACAWETREGHYVRVYYPPGKPRREIETLLRGLDATVEKDCSVLGVRPLDFKISVFCFADDALQRKLAGDEEEPDNTAHTFWDCITIAYDTWDNLEDQMAHELCHILVANRLTDKVHGLVDEGLCEYVARQSAPAEDRRATFAASPIPLRTLARDEVFFDWEQARDTDSSGWGHYTTAEAFVTYLITQRGLPKFKAFYQRIAQHTGAKHQEGDEGEALGRALLETYRIPLTQMEAQWRAAMPPPKQAPPSLSPPAAFSHSGNL